MDLILSRYLDYQVLRQLFHRMAPKFKLILNFS